MRRGPVLAAAAACVVLVGAMPAAIGAPAPTATAGPSDTSSPIRTATAPGLSAARETGGIVGTLTTLAAAPDGTIYGSDDRGVWRLEASGWRLIREVEYAAPTGRPSVLRAQFSRWPGALRVIADRSAPAEYVIIAADGSGSDIVRSTDGGATWVEVALRADGLRRSSDPGISLLCYSPLDVDLLPDTWDNTLLALVGNGVYTSNDLGRTWRLRIQEPGADPVDDPLWPADCDMGSGSDLAAHDLTTGSLILGNAQDFSIEKGDEFIYGSTGVCADESSIEGRAVVYGRRVVVLSDTGCYSRGTYDAQTGEFGAWEEKRVTGTGSMGAFVNGYFQVPTGATMHGDTAYFATETGIFAYSWSQDRWFPASRGIPLHSRAPVPTFRSGSWIVAGGYQGGVNVLGLFTSSDDGATFSRMTGVPARAQMRYFAQASETRAYLIDEDAALATFDFYRTENGGTSWSKANAEPITWVPLASLAIGGDLYVVSHNESYECCELQVSQDLGETFAPVDISMCGLPARPDDLDGITLTARPGGGIVLLHHVKSSTALGGCTLAGAESTPAPVTAPAVPANFSVSLLTFRDGRLWAYPTQGGRALTSDDGGANWAQCTTDTDLTAPPGIQSIARESATSLVATALDPANGTRIVRSTDGCGWDTGVLQLADPELDMASMVLPEDGELVVDEDDPELVSADALRRARSERAASTRTTTISILRAIGPGLRGSVVKPVRFGPAPGAPGRSKATTAKGRVTLQVTAPRAKGGGLVGYTATCTAPRKPARSATSKTATIVVTGMAAKTTYTCKITANDAAGPGPALTWPNVRIP